MARYIDAFALSNKVFESKKDNPHADGIVRRTHNHEHDHFLKMIADAPTADVVEVKHGYWKYSHKENVATCSVCGYDHYLGTYHQYATNGCPNCLAKMDGKT